MSQMTKFLRMWNLVVVLHLPMLLGVLTTTVVVVTGFTVSSSSSSSTRTTTTNIHQNNPHVNVNYLDTLSSTTEEKEENDTAPRISSSSPPDDHYAKLHPMAGWAGYKHSQWGGYLDNLKQPQEEGEEEGDNENPVATASIAKAEEEEKESSTGSSSTFEQHKPSNYGNDVRWGAEVYLSSIS